MKKMMKLMGVALLLGMFSGCSLIDDIAPGETPTQERMQGVWEITAVTESSNGETVDVLNSLNLLIPSYVHLKDNGYMMSSAGPLFLYLVYGRNNWTDATAKIDQFFDYAKLNTTDGRFWIGTGVVDNFAANITLGPPSSQTIATSLETIMEVFGVPVDLRVPYIEHKYENISISFTGDNTMYWEWTEYTDGIYNVYNEKGNLVLWNGVDANKFSKCRMKFEKRQSTLVQLMDNATKK